MSIVVSIISAIIKSIANNNIENQLAKDLVDISIDGISEKGSNAIYEFINTGKTKIKNVLSKENMKAMNISHADYVVAEITNLLSKIEINDEVLRECKYDKNHLNRFLWDTYCTLHVSYIEHGNDIKRGLYEVADKILVLKLESENLEKELLIHISNSVDNVEFELEKILDFTKENSSKLDDINQIILDIMKMLLNQYSHSDDHDKCISLPAKSRTNDYAKRWNDNMFLNNFDKRDENRGVNVKLGDVYLESHLPHYTWRHNHTASDDLKSLLSECININDKKHMLLILGQPGIGKSTLITWIAANFKDAENKILVYQFASDLKDLAWYSPDKSLFGTLVNKLKLSYDDLNGRTLILDGFDEINIDHNRVKVLNRLYWEIEKERSLPNFSLIITCRENYIPHLDNVECSYITLQPWNTEQIDSFCNVFSQKAACQIKPATREMMTSNNKVFGIPLILYMALALNISFETKDSLVDVYDQIFSMDGGIYDRCINRKRYADFHRIGDIKKQLHNISERIAFWIFENNSEEASIPYEEYEKICDEISNEDKKIKQDALIANYFKLIRHCEVVTTDKLYFIHRSIYEYFVADYICMSILVAQSESELAGILGILLNKNRLSIQILEYLKHKIRKCELNNNFSTIKKTFLLMLRDGMTYYSGKQYKNVIDCELVVFSNMLELIHLWEHNELLVLNSNIRKYLYCNEKYDFNLSKIDFSISEVNLHEVSLKGCNLTGANFYDTNLRDTALTGANLTAACLDGLELEAKDLRNTTLRNAILRRAHLVNSDFQGADLSGANLRGADLSGANLMGANLIGMKLERALIDGTTWSWDNVMVLKSQINKVKFSHITIVECDFQEERRIEISREEFISGSWINGDDFIGDVTY